LKQIEASGERNAIETYFKSGQIDGQIKSSVERGNFVILRLEDFGILGGILSIEILNFKAPPGIKNLGILGSGFRGLLYVNVLQDFNP